MRMTGAAQIVLPDGQPVARSAQPCIKIVISMGGNG
jgi:hypothetical protein